MMTECLVGAEEGEQSTAGTKEGEPVVAGVEEGDIKGELEAEAISALALALLSALGSL